MELTSGVGFLIFYLIFGVWEVSQSTGNCLEIDLDEFSAREAAYSCIVDYFHDFDDFAVVSGGLTLLPEGPRTL